MKRFKSSWMISLIGASLVAGAAGERLLGQPIPPLPAQRLAFGAFIAQFAPDGTFALEGAGWPSFKGTWTSNGSRIEHALRPEPRDNDAAYAYDVSGRLRWKVDLGRIDLGAYDIPTFEWGPASSGSGFSASPVAADGRIYLSNEDGEIVVVGAGPAFSHIATNSMGEPLMATPDLSEGVMYVRSSATLFAIGRRT
jgi:hypothetical protein